MNKIPVVAKWEYLEKIKSKAFLVGLLLTPIIMVGMGVLPGVFASREDKETKVIGIIDQSGDIADEFTRRMERNYTLPDGQPRYLIQPIAVGRNIDLADAVQRADQGVLDNTIEGYFIVPEHPLADSLVQYRSQNVGDFRVTGRVEETLRNIITEQKVAALGLNREVLRQLKVPLDVELIKLSQSGEAEKAGFEQVFFTAYIYLMMLFFLIFTSGQLLVRSVIEEKSNRIVEMLVSSCSPSELMAGKVLGLSGLGFTQMGFWALIGFALSMEFGIDFVPLDQALLLLVYFVLGYLFYASVFIGLGSPVTTEQEAQQLSSYLVIFLIMPVALALPAMQNPNAGWLKVLSYIPLLTPTIMALRIPIQMPATGEIVATLLILFFSTILGMWAAGRIFRIAILSTGKRPSLAQIVRWARTG